MRVYFLTPLIVRFISDNRWRLTRQFRVEVEEDARRVTQINVPSGFLTDFASVPRLPLAYLVAGGKASEAATVHDYLYSAGNPHHRGRKWADDVFAAAMKAQGISTWRRTIMYWAVRLGAGAYFKGRAPK